LFDTGTSNGNLSGQSRVMSSIDFRPARPYRLVSGSEDNTVAIFEGPPFKFMTLFHEHTRFVYCVRYNPSGTLFASAGADGKVVLYEGTNGSKEGEFVDEQCKGGVAHSGSVFGLCWSPDGQHIATASGDRTVKIWDVASKKLVKLVSYRAFIYTHLPFRVLSQLSIRMIKMNFLLRKLSFLSPRSSLQQFAVNRPMFAPRHFVSQFSDGLF
uniref:WD_REPEATS_REGION domain-containing protein n=1 Tax=Gongylonema pulchrum TaxID=637853 RepID=A0A183F167_9BILA